MNSDFSCFDVWSTIHCSVCIYMHAKSNQALVKQLEREVRLKSLWGLRSALWQPQLKKHNFQHKSSTRSMPVWFIISVSEGNSANHPLGGKELNPTDIQI